MAHIVRFQGGLGNQLFEYALYKKFESLGYCTYADLWKYRGHGRGRDNRKFKLDKLGITLKEAPKSEIIHYYCNEDINVIRLFNYKFGTRWLRFFGKNKYYEESLATVELSILEAKEGYFSGYWQSEKYFRDIKREIRECIRFPKLGEEGEKYAEQIREVANPVSVHVRLTDYIDQSKRFGNICTSEYYNNAINYIRERTQSAIFYVFSDDIYGAKELLTSNSGIRIVYIDQNEQDDDFDIESLYLMSICRHNIIANSSFSWWGAWLGQDDNKIIVAPKRWLADAKCDGIVPDDWVRL